MSNLDDRGRIPPPRQPSAPFSLSSIPASSSSSSSSPLTSTSTPNRRIFPGFLSTNSPDDDDYKHSHRLSRSPSPESPGLPYLRDSPASSSTTPFPARPSSQERIGTSSRAPERGSTGSGSRGSKRRPFPLNLGKAKEVGLDEELSAQRELDPPLTAITIASEDDQSTLSNEMEDLSILRQSVKHNLLARPYDSPLPDSDSDRASMSERMRRQSSDGKVEDSIDISTVMDIIQSSAQLLILDTRPLGEFLDSHLPQSANVSIPTLIFKRFKKQSGGGKGVSWDTLGSFVSTPAGKTVWSGISLSEKVNVVVLGLTALDETAKVLRGIMEGLIKDGEAKILRGGWASVLGNQDATEQMVFGDHSTTAGPSTSSSSFAGSKPAPAMDVQQPHIPSSESMPRLPQRPSLPSLKSDAAPGSQRNLPSLSLQPTASSSRRPPKLSLNLDKPLRSATLGSFPSDPPQTAAGFLPVPGQQGRRAPPPPGLSLSPPKTPLRATSFQTLCHEQSKLPPSPSSFGGIKGSVGSQEDIISPSANSIPGTPWTSSFTAKPEQGHSYSSAYPNQAAYGSQPTGSMTARQALSPFIVSTILPSFLFLGPEITSLADIKALKDLGVKRILNVAIECDDDEELRLKETFDKYLKVPMRDIVEESGVAKGMRDACDFLDDARLHSAPTYVHCKAGKSRSVTVVLAYLIHANAWTLKTAYAYVADRRRGISPNIGFVSELMQFEEAELGLKQSGGVHGEGSGRKAGGGGGASSHDDKEKEDRAGSKSNPRYMRESLPPTWAHSLDSGPPSRLPIRGDDEDKKKEGAEESQRPVGDEREVRKNGQWVHHRRAPVDRTTLQPGRRVSKAGLESLRPLASTSPHDRSSDTRQSPAPSPTPLEGSAAEHKSNTPSGEGRLGWI